MEPSEAQSELEDFLLLLNESSFYLKRTAAYLEERGLRVEDIARDREDDRKGLTDFGQFYLKN